MNGCRTVRSGWNSFHNRRSRDSSCPRAARSPPDACAVQSGLVPAPTEARTSTDRQAADDGHRRFAHRLSTIFHGPHRRPEPRPRGTGGPQLARTSRPVPPTADYRALQTASASERRRPIPAGAAPLTRTGARSTLDWTGPPATMATRRDALARSCVANRRKTVRCCHSADTTSPFAAFDRGDRQHRSTLGRKASCDTAELDLTAPVGLEVHGRRAPCPGVLECSCRGA